MNRGDGEAFEFNDSIHIKYGKQSISTNFVHSNCHCQMEITQQHDKTEIVNEIKRPSATKWFWNEGQNE